MRSYPVKENPIGADPSVKADKQTNKHPFTLCLSCFIKDLKEYDNRLLI